MAVSNYQNLIVWKKSMDLAKEVYSVVKLLPKEELYALSDQIRRSVVSIPSKLPRDVDANQDLKCAIF